MVSKPKKNTAKDAGIQRIQRVKKNKFIKFYRESRGHITNSAKAAGIDRGTYYNWLDSDEEFALAIAEAESELNDEMKKILVDMGAEDKNLGAVIFYLKNRHPEFKQNRGIGAKFTKGDMSVEFVEYES